MKEDGKKELVAKKRGPLGQVLVEMMLILPVFFTIVFTIMDMGNLAFQVILLNHATYEVARVAGMTRAAKDPFDPSIASPNCQDLQGLMKEIIANATVTCEIQDTMPDTQPDPDMPNKDVIVTGKFPVAFMFPMSSWMMSSKFLCPQGPGAGKCFVSTTVRMPIERPLPN